MTTCARAGGSAGCRYPFLTQKERDIETGLDYLGARYYACTQGRFSSVDPMLVDMNRMFDPQRINAYAYTRNNPLALIDPDGADPQDPKVVVNRTDTTYKVQGKTADEALNDASAKGASRHANGDRLIGETKSEINYTTRFNVSAPRRVSGGFITDAKTTDVTVTVTITVDTPEWEGYAQAAPEEQQKWDAMSNKLKDHEEGHVEIVLKGASEDLARQFRRVSINIHDFQMVLPVSVHTQLHRGGARGGVWNREWETFFRRNPQANRDQVFKHLVKLIEKYNLHRHAIVFR